jgi:hypothetical protein
VFYTVARFVPKNRRIYDVYSVEFELQASSRKQTCSRQQASSKLMMSIFVNCIASSNHVIGVYLEVWTLVNTYKLYNMSILGSLVFSFLPTHERDEKYVTA